MIHIQLPETQVHRLPFYLAMEEWVARRLPAADYFFTWRVQPTVIFGRNQLIDAEVDLDYCRQNNIQVYRRKSGGGCVYADLDNVMMSYITPRTDVEATFADYTARVADALRALGLDAHPSGRNDVLIGQRKVSGNAYYRLPDRSIVHGTMLHSTNVQHMLHAITPSRSKLESKQVQSVAARIITVSECCDIALDDFERHLISHICGSQSLTLTKAQVAEIQDIEQQYYQPEFIYGRRSGNRPRRTRIEGVGEFSIQLQADATGRITALDIMGDYLLRGDLDSLLLPLNGCPLQADALRQALAETATGDIIHGLDSEQLINLILTTQPTYNDPV